MKSYLVRKRVVLDYTVEVDADTAAMAKEAAFDLLEMNSATIVSETIYASLADKPKHTVRGKTSDTGWPYGTTHDMDCPACLVAGSSFLTSPRSETYWSS